MELSVINKEGQPTGRTISLDQSVFNIEANDHAIYLDVKRFLASLRQGTHKTKERAEVAGSTRKLKKQKGTGGARIGDIKSPLLRGGGRVFGPRPRNYDIKVNKKVRVLARKSALTHKAKDESIIVVEDFNYDKPSTKDYVAFLKNIQVENKKSLHLTTNDCDNVWLSSRNLQKNLVLPVTSANTYEILNNKVLVISETALNLLQESLKKSAE